MKRAVVTGANGFIGAALCRGLSEQGIEVIAVVKGQNADVSELSELTNVKIVYCDLSDFRNLPDLIEVRPIDVLYHLAWVGSAGVLRGSYDVQTDNIRYTCEAVQACAGMGCKRFVFAASIMEYEIQSLMQTEATPGINTLYCSAKVAADYMARALAGSLGVQYIRAVISNVYGPEKENTRIVNASLRKMLSGKHCSFSAGEQIYDFIYISDAVAYLIAIGARGHNNRTYYIGSLKPQPLKMFLTEMKNQVDPSMEIGLGEIPFEGVSLDYTEFDVEAVKKDTGTEPQVSFAEGIQKTITWLRQNSEE